MLASRTRPQIISAGSRELATAIKLQPIQPQGSIGFSYGLKDSKNSSSPNWGRQNSAVHIVQRCHGFCLALADHHLASSTEHVRTTRASSSELSPGTILHKPGCEIQQAARSSQNIGNFCCVRSTIENHLFNTATFSKLS